MQQLHTSRAASLRSEVESWVDGYREYEARAALNELLRHLKPSAQRSILNDLLYTWGWLVAKRRHRWEGDRLLWRAAC